MTGATPQHPADVASKHPADVSPQHPADVAPLTPADVAALTAATTAGAVVLFPAEGVYGLAADPRDPDAVARMVALKGRDPAKPSALMLWSISAALAAVGEAGEGVRSALGRLLPGPVGVLVAGGGGPFAAACGPDGTLGLRLPRLPAPVDAPPVLQTSANLAGGPDARTVGDVPASVRDGCDLVLDRGPRPGTPSTLVDLRGLDDPDGTWRIVRVGAVPEATIASALADLGRRAD